VELLLRERLKVAVPGPDVDLFESGLVDSVNLVLMVASIEETFGVVVDLIDLDLDDLSTVNAITELVMERSQGGVGVSAPPPP
jgi:D-alanine--poly(phosphoribitol) ligase subunit 2